MPRAFDVAMADAAVLSALLGFLVYLVLALWIVAERRPWRAVVWPLAIVGLGFGLAHLLAPTTGG